MKSRDGGAARHGCGASGRHTDAGPRDNDAPEKDAATKAAHSGGTLNRRLGTALLTRAAHSALVAFGGLKFPAFVAEAPP